jgi:lycopene cyclase domain-containing protein
VKFLYLALDLFSLLGPLALSFDKRVAFHKRWKALFPAIFVMMLIFIPWDILKTAKGVWGFNPDYILGIYFFNLPLEECLFFICIPYACVFIYECLNSYVKRDFLQAIHRPLLIFLALLLLLLGLTFHSRWYPAFTFPYAAVLLLLMLFVFRVSYLSRFFLAYLVTLLPFLLVNGILTGSLLPAPVVWYSSEQILNIRIITIPIEDTIYNLGMLATTVLGYEYLKKRWA